MAGKRATWLKMACRRANIPTADLDQYKRRVFGTFPCKGTFRFTRAHDSLDGSFRLIDCQLTETQAIDSISSVAYSTRPRTALVDSSWRQLLALEPPPH